VGAELDLRPGDTVVPLEAGFEHALVVLSGAASVDARVVDPGHLAYLGTGRDECRFDTADGARAMLVGGLPLDESVLMWWNFVARTRQEINYAYRDWTDEADRFGRVASDLSRIPVRPPPWPS